MYIVLCGWNHGNVLSKEYHHTNKQSSFLVQSIFWRCILGSSQYLQGGAVFFKIPFTRQIIPHRFYLTYYKIAPPPLLSNWARNIVSGYGLKVYFIHNGLWGFINEIQTYTICIMRNYVTEHVLPDIKISPFHWWICTIS